MQAGYQFVDVDIDDGGGESIRFRGGALVVARRAGVPVGSRLFHRAPAGARPLADHLDLREDEPPGPAPGSTSITVAVCTKDRPALLDRCLESIVAAIDVAGREAEVEVLVVDNASSGDGTRHTAEARGARVVREEVPGLDFARNRAVASAATELVAFVDDDVVVDRFWLRTLVRAFAAAPAAQAVAGQVLAMNLDTPARIDFERTSGFSLGWAATDFTVATGLDMPFRPGMGVGCNMAFRRTALVEVGPFDEALDTGRPLPGGGDIDMLMRMVLAGGIRYEPSAVVFHEHRRTWRELRYQFYTWGKGWGAVLDKWYRASPAMRPRIRGVARWTFRGYVADVVRGPRRTGRYRRWHGVLIGVGFVIGWLGTYQRSVRRVDARRRAASSLLPPAVDEHVGAARQPPPEPV
jgi:GT2 family glycosyltransferase